MKQWSIVLLLLTTPFFSAFSQPGWPEITSENKPWTRWWWPGNAVDTANIGMLMEIYAKAGLGGLEIVPIYGVKGTEDQYLPYLGTEWVKALQYTLKKAKDLNIGIDMANGTGWPFGGSWVSPQNASKYLTHLSYNLHEGESVTENLHFTGQYIRTVARHSPVIDQLRKSDQIKPFRVMAYDNLGTALDLTSQMDDEGKLNWTAPRGNWKVIALFSANHGKMVERAAPGAEGFAIDHFAEPALMQYLQHFDSAFAGIDVGGIRCMFNDSYEVDDAFGQADWTSPLPDEFTKRRGYDLFQYLPMLLNDSGSTAQRVIYDYRLTVSELLLNQFTLPWRRWTNGKGALTRNQAHGSPANILDLYAASDIPETEGSDILRFKFASSAGNVTGKRLISAEAATWLNDHFISTLADVKAAADNYFLGGVNHLIYHGTAYSPLSDSWPGWLFYAAVHFQPTNPMWEQFPALNSYIARTQSLLQQGQADNDVLLYYPLADRLSDRGDQLLRHFDGMEKEFHGTGFETCSRQMTEKGYAFDFISDLQLQQTTLQNNLIRTSSGTTYQTIIIPDCHFMPFTTWQGLLDLVKSGATVMFYKSAPVEVPGLKDNETYQAEFTNLRNALTFQATDVSNIRQANYGNGKFLLAEDLSTMLEHEGVRREGLTDKQLQFVRRKTGSNILYFISNRSPQPFDGWIPLQCEVRAAKLFDAFSGFCGEAPIRRQADGTAEIYLKLKPAASILIMASSEESTGEPFPFYEPSGPSATIDKVWKVDFISGGPVIPPRRQIARLTSWADWGDETKDFSGLAQYTTSFSRPRGKADHYLLCLGKVSDCADVLINGEPVAKLIGPDFSVVIESKKLKKKNQLEIVVANRMANRIIGMDKTGLVYKKFHNVNFPANKRENAGSDGLFTAAQWEPFPAGLLGPVTLTPVQVIIPK